MLKATRLSAVLLGLVTLGMLGASTAAFAEVQNVKVGGDVTTRAFWRSNLDLQDNTAANALNDDRFWQMLTGLNVGADLTENVAAFIRLASENRWDALDNAGSQVSLSQAYVRLKELFYSPLTVTLGRQPIVWGRGFVLGSNLIPGVVGNAGDLTGGLSADEFTDFTAFNAARATLDFAGAAAVDLPLTLDLVYIKLDENIIGISDDVNLMGFNLGSKFDAANSEVEAYYLNKRDKSGETSGATHTGNIGSVSTMGVRGSAAPIEGSSVYGEIAYQFGTRATDPYGLLPTGDAQQAWAWDLGAEFTATDVAMTPKVGAEWVFYSGTDHDGGMNGWDPIARSYFTTPLRDFQVGNGLGSFYPNAQTCNSEGLSQACSSGQSNQHQFSLYGSVKPLEDLTVAPRISWFFTDEGLIPNNGVTSDGTVGTVGQRVGKRQGYIGSEWDTVVTYNYTDDVQFGVIYGAFFPGNVFRAGRDNVAQELVTTVGVKF